MTKSPATIDIAGTALPLRICRNGRAERLSLRMTAAGDAAVLVLPAGVPLREGLRFAAERGEWLRTRLASLPPRVALVDGAAVPLLGVEHCLRHRPEARRGVWAENGAINVSGQIDHFARRVTDWLREQARAAATARAHAMAGRIGRAPRRIAVRDTTSRWGSCTASGNLAFSWRLVMAPEAVLDYVVAHEVAHLVEMNHGPAFWRLVGRLVADAPAARQWLRRHGATLHRYG